MTNKKLVACITALVFLSAGCNFFSASLPTGIIKSTNGGADWQFSNAVSGSSGGGLVSQSISKLDFDPGNHQVLFAGSYNGGLFKSEDSASTWKNVLSKIFVYDFTINPIDSKVIYAAGFFADHGRVLKTTDGGASWNQVYNEESSTNPVRAIALNVLNPSQIIIGTASGSVLKSADGGNTWKLVNNFADQVNRVLWQNGNIYVLLKTKGLFQSSGFAENFTEITQSLNKTFSLGSMSYTQDTIDSFSQAYVDFSAPTLIYVTTNKGIYKTVDGGKTWTAQKLPVKPSESGTRAIAIARSSSNIVFTSVGNTIYKSLDGGNAWQTQGITSGGFVNYILIDPQLPQIVYAGIYNTQ